MKKRKIIGLVRQRNEGLILEEAVKHALIMCDFVLIYDDNSDDQKTINILHKLDNEEFSSRVIYDNAGWSENDRDIYETVHRQALLNAARDMFGKDFIVYYFDADEVMFQLVPMRRFLLSIGNRKRFAITSRLFDAHATPGDCVDYKSGSLFNLRKKFCPRHRDIMMIWSNCSGINFEGIDMREPYIMNIENINLINMGLVQHYGKGLTEKRWDQKCRYYMKYFPDKYGKKWEKRLGKYVHDKSDFGDDLIDWSDIKCMNYKYIVPSVT